MARSPACLAFVVASVAAAPVTAEEVFRCTAPDGKVTYQQAPCPKTETERRIDATPANPDYDPAQRERILKQGEEADRRLEQRAAREREEARQREEARLRAEQLEREARAREEARDAPVYVWGWPGYGPRPPQRPQPPVIPQPRPQAPSQPRPSGR